MKTKQKKILFALSLVVFLSSKLEAQITTIVDGVNCNSSSCSHLYDSPGTLISTPDVTQPVNFSGTSQIDYVATDGIQLLPGFTANAYTTGGYFHAYTDLSGYDVLLDPLNNQVPEFEKAEFSIQLPSSVQTLINNTIQHLGTQSQRINPCNPDSMSVEATFTSPSQVTKVVYGFYSEDYIYSGVVTDPDTRWSSIHNDHKFRVRFAPNELGLWTCSIAVKYPTGSAQNYTFGDITFSCISSNNKGYVTTGNNGYLKFSKTNETFFPIGAYLGWANFRYDNTGYNPYAQDPQTLRPVEYNDYYSYLETIKNSGGNYVRVMITSISWGLEWENVGTYYERLPQAWELDRVVQYCEQNGIYISLTITHSGDFIDWNTNDHSQTSASNGGAVWDDNPYKKFLQQLPNNYQEPIDPTLFITEPAVKVQYEKFIRYVVSRWSYSTHVAKLELMNEGNQIGHAFQPNTNQPYNYNAYGRSVDQGFMIPSSYQYTPPNWSSTVTNHTFSYDLGQWNISIASYITNTLKANQLITCSNAIGPWDLENSDDATFSSPLISTISHHHALDNLNCNIQRKNMIDRYKSAYGNKPFIYEEIYPQSGNIPYPGNSNVYESPSNQNDAEFHNAAWATCFSRAAGTTPLLFPAADVNSYPQYFNSPTTEILTGQLKTKQFYIDNIPALAAFMNGVDLQNQFFQAVVEPDVGNIPAQSEIEKYYMYGSYEAMGWVHLKTWYWATADLDQINNPCRDDNGNTWSIIDGSLPEDPGHGATPSPISTESMDISMGQLGSSYWVDWYDTRTGQIIYPQQGPYTPVFNPFVHLIFPIPTLSAPINCSTCYPDLAFKLYKVGSGFQRITQKDSAFHFGIMPNPSKGVFNLVMKQSSGNPSVEVFDVLGNSVYKKHFTDLQNGQIDISELSSGVYYVHITDETSINETHKIVKE